MSATLFVLAMLLCSEAWCFPGVLVGKDNAPRVVHTTHEVLLIHGAVSVVTVMVDYDGPMDPLVLLMPVPEDITLERVQAVKREFISRIEKLSAPRFHAFYEKDPCDPGALEQDWDVRYAAAEAGFLAPPFMPPPERNWTVSNVIGIATTPVFKQNESEFRFHLLPIREPRALETWLSARGYRASPEALGALVLGLQERRKLLAAEVNVQRAELLGNGGLQLGGIRYWSRQPVSKIASTLGLQNSAGVQDLFLYILHPSQRYQALNYANVFLPTNLEVDPAAAERLATLYNSLYDTKLALGPAGVVSEFVWPTFGCGEPCPNAPLTLSELMSLGGDVMEAEFVSRAARSPDPGRETQEEGQEFELQLQGKSPLERAQARRQHQKDRWELARRHALIARQRYVLSRLHTRYNRNTLPRDIELEATAEPIQGGIGIPVGPQGLLINGTRPAKESRFQMRFVSLFPWTKGFQCPTLVRWRWGRRWKSLDAVLRKVWLADDLPRNSRDTGQLAMFIRTPIAELGPAPTPPAPTPISKPIKHTGCALHGHGRVSNLPTLLALIAALRAARRKARACGHGRIA